MTRVPLSAALLLLLTACGDRPDPRPAPKPAAAIAVRTPLTLSRAGIDNAVFAQAPSATTVPLEPSVDAAVPAVASTTEPDPAVLRAQVLLDRANFSPGVIDGLTGENVRQAIAAYESAKGLPMDGLLDAQVYASLVVGDVAPALTDYVITDRDVAGPFVPVMPADLEARSRLAKLAYSGPAELLSETFHTTPAVLEALNPGLDLTKAGTAIVVPAVGPAKLAAPVTRIVVDKAERAVKAFGADGQLLAFYPASIGSDDRPAPDGSMTVRAVAPNPTYTFDPRRLTFGTSKTKVTIPAGPNSPVGLVWIDLSKDTFGIHGTDEPKDVGKKFSHGCIRLTNWDAQQLAAAVKAGVKVVFTG